MGKWKRRAFISAGVIAGGAVIVGVAIRPGNRSTKVKGLIADKEDAVFNVWLKIAPDNTITAIIPHAEMGQGVHTSLAMMLAEELDAEVAKYTDYYKNAPTLAIGLMKKMLNKSFHSDLNEMLQYEAYCQEIAGNSSDYKEGVTAFNEKRKPHFKGN